HPRPHSCPTRRSSDLTNINAHFFSGVNETTGFILALATFAAGFLVRPFGALVFGRIGDIVGRKNTFLVTMIIMGASTFAVGLLRSEEHTSELQSRENL